MISATTKIENLLSNIGSLGVKLNAEELKEIGEAIPADEVGGERELGMFSEYVYKLANTPYKAWFSSSRLRITRHRNRLRMPTSVNSFHPWNSVDLKICIAFSYSFTLVKSNLSHIVERKEAIHFREMSNGQVMWYFCVCVYVCTLSSGSRARAWIRLGRNRAYAWSVCSFSSLFWSISDSSTSSDSWISIWINQECMIIKSYLTR